MEGEQEVRPQVDSRLCARPSSPFVFNVCREVPTSLLRLRQEQDEVPSSSHPGYPGSREGPLVLMDEVSHGELNRIP